MNANGAKHLMASAPCFPEWLNRSGQQDQSLGCSLGRSSGHSLGSFSRVICQIIHRFIPEEIPDCLSSRGHSDFVTELKSLFQVFSGTTYLLASAISCNDSLVNLSNPYVACMGTNGQGCQLGTFISFGKIRTTFLQNPLDSNPGY